jgi:CRP-like cAMP-binding protein
MSSDAPSTAPLIRKLESILPLTEDEKQAVLDLPMHVRKLDAGQDIVREGDRPWQCGLLLDGFAHRHKIVGEGQRQIMSVHIPGEMPDLMSLHLAVMDHTLSALTSSSVGFISHQHMRRLMRDHPRIGDAFWRDALVDAAILREWMVGIGRRDARGRIAHLFCELVIRMEAVGLAEGKAVQFPMSQAFIADAVGVSTIHANRVLQELRSEGLIELRNKTLRIKDWDGLQKAAEFDPVYLHLAPE